MAGDKPKWRPATRTVYANDLAFVDDAGETHFPRAGEWVRFKRRFKMKLLRVAARLERLNDDDAGVAEVEEAFGRLAELLAEQVVDWNWSDLDTEPDEEDNYPPLPPPTVDAMWELSQDELFWILDNMMEETEASKNSESP